MNKFLVTSDLHITNSNSKFKKSSDGLSDLLVAQMDFVKWLCEESKQRDCDGILFLGDLTDQETLSPVVQFYSNEIIKMLSSGKGSVVLEGNHCVSDVESHYTVLSAANTLIGNDSIVYQPEVKKVGNVSFHCMPYLSSESKMMEKIRGWNKDIEESLPELTHVLLFHFPIKNAMLDNGLKSPSGVELRQEDVSNFDLCLGGDFHTEQKVFDDCYYIGAPFDFKFGEHYRRTVKELVIDKNGYEMNKIENPYQYDIIKMDAKEYDGYSFRDKSRTILKLEGKVGDRFKDEIEKESDSFYFLYDSTHTGYDTDDDVKTSVDIIDEDNDVGDQNLIEAQMEGMGITDDQTKEKVIGLFNELKNN